RSMWNPALFSGIPTYYSWSAVIWNLDTIMALTIAKLTNYNTLFYFIGAFGMFCLLRFFKFDRWVCVFGSIAVLMIIHTNILFQEGHFSKFRTLMMLPFVLYTFLRMLDKPSLMNLAWYILAQSIQVRGLHYQIVFYTAIMLAFIGVWKLIEQKDDRQAMIKTTGFSLIAIVLVIGILAHPIFMTKEYTPYSIRGGKTEQETSSQSVENPKDNPAGLGYDYATNWSFPPSEIMEFVIPDFYGGPSGIYYTGNNPKYRQIKNRQIYGYWGDQTFVAASEYIGIIIIFFAIIAMIHYRRNKFIITLIALICFSLILSFGKYFPLLYDLFYYYVPAFNKFRAPKMIITIVIFTFIILSGFGLNAIIEQSKEKSKELLKYTLISGGILVGLCLLSHLFSGVLDFTNARELQSIQKQQLDIFIDIRQELFAQNVNRSLIFIILITGLTFAYLKGKIQKVYVYLAIVLLSADLYTMNQKHLFQKINGRYIHLNNYEQFKQAEFQKTETDQFLLAQKRTDLDLAEYRIYPLVSDFWNTNEYSFYHQSIGGYHPAKLRIYQDLIDYGAVPKNSYVLARNIWDMLNAKYVVTTFNLPDQQFPNLQPVHQSNQKIIYLNKQAAGRAWFVGNLVQSKSLDQTFDLLKSTDFDIHQSAIVESNENMSIQEPQNDTVITKTLSLHELSFSVKNDAKSLLVISEVYYPEGWKAFIDGQETEIYQTNHVLRSVVVPTGEHTVELKFNPPNLARAIQISLWSTIITVILLLIGIYIEKKDQILAIIGKTSTDDSSAQPVESK
ncbi:MAG: YfhO family protein, partial [Calditrichaeota bacterium]|nr:YfhO family protein [Calditrichota bacterium]